MREGGTDMKIKVGLIGFGKTGKAVATVLLGAEEISLEWVLRQSNSLERRSAAEWLGISSDAPCLIYNTAQQTSQQLLDAHPVDVIVDFSADAGVHYYGEAAARRGIAIVSAISNYSHESLGLVRRLAIHTRVLHSPNITLGINFLIIAAKVLRNIAPTADVEIIEEHFKQKPEVSGTARTIARHLRIENEEIKTIRAGGIIGRHEVLFGFPFQTVRLSHESIAREAFGNGVLFALNNLPRVGKGLYSMEDLLIPYFRVARNSPAQAYEADTL